MFSTYQRTGPWMEHKTFKSKSAAISAAKSWFAEKAFDPFDYQIQTWNAFLSCKSGLVNAPTGSGKTYALLIPAILEGMIQGQSKSPGYKVLWITPVKALAREIEESADRAIIGLGSNWKVNRRTGDTDTSTRLKQKQNIPEILITTPESLHILLASRDTAELLLSLNAVIIDEWHEFLGSKRGVQVELALSRLKASNPRLKLWGISATLSNLDEALHVLLGNDNQKESLLVKAEIKKHIEVETILPDVIERLPWSGHLGLSMAEKIAETINHAESTLIFTNTRSQCEIWFQQILGLNPELAGSIAMHHGSISKEQREWVENALSEGLLKAVFCTSSLDLGVDFGPVERVIQIGSPKGIARLIQRAGRSGHRPGAISKIYIVPTHSLELIDAAALKEAVVTEFIEEREPFIRAFDVLVQYLVTIATGTGLDSDMIYKEVKSCFAYESMSREEWLQILNFVINGGSLTEYDEFRRLVPGKDGILRIANKQMASRHRLSIGTIVGDSTLSIQFQKGKIIGNVEEWFLSQLKPGDTFWFSGRALEFVRIRDMTAYVRSSQVKKAIVPAWMGGRIPLSSLLSASIRQIIEDFLHQNNSGPELEKLKPLLELQQTRSHLPSQGEMLIEYYKSKEGHHLLFYPFEGRMVHEGIAALIAQRIGKENQISISMAMNDYGFEILSDIKIDILSLISNGIFSIVDLSRDIIASINTVELAQRRFRDIAAIAGLVFRGYPGRIKRERHLQSSGKLIFEVFREHEPDNLLYLQAYEEVLHYQLEENRIRECLKRINSNEVIYREPGKFTPFAFPIIVDRMRQKMSTESLEKRIQKMIFQSA